MPYQPATSRLLICELEDFLRQCVENYPFPSPDGGWLDCKIFQYGLPVEQEENTYPFVIIRWLEGEIQSMEDAKTVLRDTVMLALGVYNPASANQTAILLAELIDCIRRAIWKQRIIAKRFEIVEPLRCQIVDTQRQQHRFHLATIETVWNYVWPPKALEEAGQSQLRSGNMSADSYSASELAQAWAQSKSGGNNER